MTVKHYSYFFSSVATPHYLLHNTCLEFELKKERGKWQQKAGEIDIEAERGREREIKGSEMEGGNEKSSKREGKRHLQCQSSSRRLELGLGPEYQRRKMQAYIMR